MSYDKILQLYCETANLILASDDSLKPEKFQLNRGRKGFKGPEVEIYRSVKNNLEQVKKLQPNSVVEKPQKKTVSFKELREIVKDPNKKIFTTNNWFSDFFDVKQSSGFGIDSNLIGKKPNGLWYAFGSAWMDFCINDMCYDSISDRLVYELEINKSPMKIISTSEELIKFDQEYGSSSIVTGEDGLFYRAGSGINWSKVAQDYAGIEIENLGWEEYHPKWYDGWDIASGCIWNSKAFKSVKLIASKSTDGQWQLVK